MPRSVSPTELASAPSRHVLDVRRTPARNGSGLTVPGSPHRDPLGAETWWPEWSGRKVAVFCVHGHEVSQSVCATLVRHGVDAVYLEGGFEAWRDHGLPVAAIGDSHS